MTAVPEPAKFRARSGGTVEDCTVTRVWRVDGALLLLVACSTPSGLPGCRRAVTLELTRSALNSNTPSLFSQNVLHRWNPTDRFRRNSAAALERLHQLAVQEWGCDQTPFALAELSFTHAENTERKNFSLLAAVSMVSAPSS